MGEKSPRKVVAKGFRGPDPHKDAVLDDGTVVTPDDPRHPRYLPAEVDVQDSELEEGSGDRNDIDREAGRGPSRQRNASSGGEGQHLEEEELEELSIMPMGHDPNVPPEIKLDNEKFMKNKEKEEAEKAAKKREDPPWWHLVDGGEHSSHPHKG
jgi:hypothetical protein